MKVEIRQKSKYSYKVSNQTTNEIRNVKLINKFQLNNTIVVVHNVIKGNSQFKKNKLSMIRPIY